MNNQTLWNKKKTEMALKVVADSLLAIAKLHKNPNIVTMMQAELIRCNADNMIKNIFAQLQYYDAAAKTVSVCDCRHPDIVFTGSFKDIAVTT